MIKAFLISALISLSLAVHSQRGFRWIKLHGDVISDHPEAVTSIESDKAGNIYIGGEVNSLFVRDSLGNTIPMISNPNLDSLYNHGRKDAWVASYTKEGELRWEGYAGGGSDFDSFENLVITNDDELVVSGKTIYNSIREAKTYDGSNLSEDNMGSYIAKISSTGNLIWHKNLGGDTINGDYVPYNSSPIGLANENGYIYLYFMGGGSQGSLGYQLLYDKDSLDLGIHEVKFDLNGNYLDVKSFPFPRSNKVPLINSIQRNASTIIITGSINTDTVFVGTDTLIRSNLDNSVCLAFDSSLNHLWSFKSSNYLDQFIDSKILEDTLVVSGQYDLINNSTVHFDSIQYTASPSTYKGVALFNFDARSGELLSFYPSESMGNGASAGAGSIAVSDKFMAISGGFIHKLTFSGTTNYMEAIDNCSTCTNRDLFFSTFSRDGSFFCEEVIYSSGNSGENVRAIHIKDSMLYLGGFIGDSVLIKDLDTLIGEGDNDAFIAAYRLGFTTSIEERPKIYKADNGILAYPNPSNGQVYLVGIPVADIAHIFSINGTLVKEIRLDQRNTKHLIDLSLLNPGIYIVNIAGKEGNQRIKIIIQ